MGKKSRYKSIIGKKRVGLIEDRTSLGGKKTMKNIIGRSGRGGKERVGKREGGKRQAAGGGI